MKDNQAEGGTGDLFETDPNFNFNATVDNFREKLLFSQKAGHPHVIRPENTIVYELLTAKDVDGICDEIADIVITSPKAARDDLLAGFIDLLSVCLDHEAGPPESFSHPFEGKIMLDRERSQAVCFQIKGKIDTMKYELERGELGRLVKRLGGTIRTALGKE